MACSWYISASKWVQTESLFYIDLSVKSWNWLLKFLAKEEESSEEGRKSWWRKGQRTLQSSWSFCWDFVLRTWFSENWLDGWSYGGGVRTTPDGDVANEGFQWSCWMQHQNESFSQFCIVSYEFAQFGWERVDSWACTGKCLFLRSKHSHWTCCAISNEE